MHTEGQEVHESTEEARAASTPNIVRWVLAISLLAAIVLLSAIWIFGAATTDDDSMSTVTDRIEEPQEGNQTDSIVSNRDQFEYEAEEVDETAESTPASEGDPDLGEQ